MYLIYLDESGNTGMDLKNKQQPIFVLAGICIKDNLWHKINNTFEEEKIKIYSDFKNYEIHTNELFNSNRKSPFYKNYWKDNLIINEKIAELISKLEIKVIFDVINKQTYRKKYKSNLNIDPYLYSFNKIYTSFNEKLKNYSNYGIFLCDELNNMENNLNIIYPNLKILNKNIIEKVFYLNSKENNFIQIADFCSFYINKYHCLKNNLSTMDDYKKEHCLKVFNIISKCFFK